MPQITESLMRQIADDIGAEALESLATRKDDLISCRGHGHRQALADALAQYPNEMDRELHRVLLPIAKQYKWSEIHIAVEGAAHICILRETILNHAP